MAEEESVSREHKRIMDVDAILEEHQELYDRLWNKIASLPHYLKCSKSPSAMKLLVHYIPPEMAELVDLLGMEPKKAANP
jgi:hypothetical protein